MDAVSIETAAISIGEMRAETGKVQDENDSICGWACVRLRIDRGLDPCQ